MKIAMLTGGGDCPGLNAVIRAVAKLAHKEGHQTFGFQYGWKGALNNIGRDLGPADVSGLLHKGGTILHTSRTNPAKDPEAVEKIKKSLAANGCDALIAIGGEDTLGAANKMAKAGIPIVGCPKTIDNDLNGTDYTFGVMTAVDIISEAIDRLHTTAESHDRVLVVEVMGRHAGWLGALGGLAGGADAILLPEEKYDTAEVAEAIKRRRAVGKNFSIIVVSEGAQPKDGDLAWKDSKVDSFGHKILGGVGDQLSKDIEKLTGFETRSVVLGHTQRGGSPNAWDRILSTRFGAAAYDAVIAKDWGKMVALQGNRIVRIPLETGVGQLKLVDEEWLKLVKRFWA